MKTERHDYDDAYTHTFRARVAAVETRSGRIEVALDRTWFYPESGGQEADRGSLADAAVIDVQVDDDGVVWHALPPDTQAPAIGAEVEGRIDAARRFDHMQQHTGQHVLSAAFERELEAPTRSSHLGEERSTIEVELADADWERVRRVERAANRIVWADLPVERHWVDEQGLARFDLRKAPAVTGRIRVVVVPEWDASACGGTHVARTGEIGIIHVTRWERVRGRVRFEFLCGGRVLADLQWKTEALIDAAKRHTLKDRELIPSLERSAEERDALRREARELEDRLMGLEVAARVGLPPRPVVEHRASMSRESVRRWVIRCLEAGAPWAVASADLPDAVVVAGRAKSAAADLREVMPAVLADSGGKGGGSPDLVQATASDPDALAKAAQRLAKWLSERMGPAVS